MTERKEERQARRLEEIIRRLARGERPQIRPQDAPDEAAIRAASRLAGAREPYPRMRPEFRRRLAGGLDRTRQGAAPSRRWALAAAAGLVGGAALGVVGDRVVQDQGGSSEQEQITPERPDARWVDTGLALDELAEDTPLPVSAGGLPLFLVRQGQRVRGLSSVCTHKPCQLLWDDAQRRIVCPWASYQTFSLDGTASSGRIPPLPTVEVRVRDGRVEVYGIS